MPKSTKQEETRKKNLEAGKPYRFSGERAVEMGKKGNKVRQENLRTKKAEQEEWAMLLNLALKNGKIEEITSLKDANGKNLKVSKAMKIKLISKALHGDIKAYETIMHYAGCEMPTDEERAESERATNLFIQALEVKARDVWTDEKSKE